MNSHITDQQHRPPQFKIVSFIKMQIWIENEHLQKVIFNNYFSILFSLTIEKDYKNTVTNTNTNTWVQEMLLYFGTQFKHFNIAIQHIYILCYISLFCYGIKNYPSNVLN